MQAISSSNTAGSCSARSNMLSPDRFRFTLMKLQEVQHRFVEDATLGVFFSAQGLFHCPDQRRAFRRPCRLLWVRFGGGFCLGGRKVGNPGLFLLGPEPSVE
jgi:hypothetical protein